MYGQAIDTYFWIRGKDIFVTLHHEMSRNVPNLLLQ